MYFMLFPRWFARRAAFRTSRAAVHAAGTVAGRGASITLVDATDHAARVSLSYHLLTTCVCVWTLFVLTFFLAGLAKYSGWDRRESPSWPFCVDAAVDLVAKLLYASLIVRAAASHTTVRFVLFPRTLGSFFLRESRISDLGGQCSNVLSDGRVSFLEDSFHRTHSRGLVHPFEAHSLKPFESSKYHQVDAHGALFDSAELSERRLEELRGLMSIVWTASSDALAVSVRHHGRVETSVSPTARGQRPERRGSAILDQFYLRCLRVSRRKGVRGSRGYVSRVAETKRKYYRVAVCRSLYRRRRCCSTASLRRWGAGAGWGT